MSVKEINAMLEVYGSYMFVSGEECEKGKKQGKTTEKFNDYQRKAKAKKIEIVDKMMGQETTIVDLAFDLINLSGSYYPFRDKLTVNVLGDNVTIEYRFDDTQSTFFKYVGATDNFNHYLYFHESGDYQAGSTSNIRKTLELFENIIALSKTNKEG